MWTVGKAGFWWALGHLLESVGFLMQASETDDTAETDGACAGHAPGFGLWSLRSAAPRSA